jgi:hypothetical protein
MHGVYRVIINGLSPSGATTYVRYATDGALRRGAIWTPTVGCCAPPTFIDIIAVFSICTATARQGRRQRRA